MIYDAIPSLLVSQNVLLSFEDDDFKRDLKEGVSDVFIAPKLNKSRI